MTEIWKDIVGYEGLYQISNLGRVKRFLKTNERIISGEEVFGYIQVALYKKGKRKMVRVHKLVAEMFIPNPNGYTSINHKDWNRKNNIVDNLEWCTQTYNNQNRSNCLKFRN